MPLRKTLRLALLLGPLPLTGCGLTAHDESSRTQAGGSPAAGASGGFPTGGGFPNSGGFPTSGGASSTAGNAGAAGETDEPAAVDISGRWGMFSFEDPVGVQLFQDGTKLTGRGCAAGAPPLNDELTGLCGDIRGSVHGRKASFGFPISFGGSYYYAADVTVSTDVRRMAGHFHAVQDLSYPMAWLHAADDEAWLPRSNEPEIQEDPLLGWYTLTLSDGDGDEYTAQVSYSLSYTGRSIYGDLGAFWVTEIVSTPGEVKAGPVAPTVLELPIELFLQGDAGGVAQVHAITGTGHDYFFAATRAR